MGNGSSTVSQGPEISHQEGIDPLSGGKVSSRQVMNPDGTYSRTIVTDNPADGSQTVIRENGGPDGRTIDYQKIGQNDEILDKGSVEYGKNGEVLNKEGTTGPIEKDDTDLSDEDPETESKCKNCGGAEAPPVPGGSIWDDIWAFGKGVVEGAVTTALAVGAVLVASAIPVVGAVLGPLAAVGLLAWGIYGVYQTVKCWSNMSSAERWEFAGGVVGGLLVGGMLKLKTPRTPKIPPEELPPPKPAPGMTLEEPPIRLPADENPPVKRPPRVINVDDLPHNRFLESPEYLEGVSKGAPELKPVGPNGGGFVNAEAGPIEGPKTLYRVGGPNGGWWSDQPPPKSLEAWRQRDGVIPEWSPNPKEVQTITIPPGEKIPMSWKGSGAPAYDLENRVTYNGGPPQYNLDPSTVSSDWKGKYTPKWTP